MIKLRCLSVLALVLSVAACHDAAVEMLPADGAAVETGPAVELAPPVTRDAGAAVDIGEAECMPSVHPGTVTFVDEDTGVTTVDDAATVPDSIKWHDTAAGRVPVIKVVKRQMAPGRIELTLYGPCGLVEVIIATTGA